MGNLSRELTARPPGHDYASELKQRFGSRPSMLRIDMCGGSSGDKRKPYQVAENVAIINISGVLVNEAFWWDEVDYGQIRKEISMAAEDSEVGGILLRFDSPGGEADGSFETGALIAQVAKRKPTWAVADTMAYSAAYLLASQAEKIYAAPVSGGLGSVGVYMMHIDFSGALEKAGIDVTFISAGEGKTEGNPYKPLSKDAKAAFQSDVDRLYMEFVAAVARGRKMPEDEIRKLGAWTYRGAKAAIGAGYADMGGTLEDAWLAMASRLQSDSQPSTFGGTSSAKAEAIPAASADDRKSTKEVPNMSTLNAADAKQPPAEKTYTEAEVHAMVAEARTKGRESITGESAEIAALCKLAGKPSLAGDFIGRKTVAEVRDELLRLQQAEDAEEVSHHQSQGQPKDQGKVSAAMIVKQCEKIAAQMGGK